MAAPASSSIIRVPGDLIWEPSNLGAARPYGGTYLGQTRDKEFHPRPKTRDIWAEEMGCVVDTVYAGEECVFKAVLRYPDADALAQVFPNGYGTMGWRFRITGSGAVRPGTMLSTNAGKLLFASRAPAAHPSILIYNAIPCYDETAQLNLSLGEEYGVGVVFKGTVDSSGRVYDHNLLASLSL